MKHECIFCGYKFDCGEECGGTYLVESNCQHHGGTNEKFMEWMKTNKKSFEGNTVIISADEFHNILNLNYIPCDNPEHDWDGDLKFCITCHVPIKQYSGEEAVKKMHEIAERFNHE